MSAFVIRKVCSLLFWYVVVSLAGIWDMVQGLKRVDFDNAALNHSALLQWRLTMGKGYMTGKPAQATLRCQRIYTLQRDHVKIDYGQTGTTHIKKRSTVVREIMWLVKWKDRTPLMWKTIWACQKNQWIQADVAITKS